MNSHYNKLYIKGHKSAQILGPRTWCTKQPFGYRVAHHGYLLTSINKITSYTKSIIKALNKTS